MKYAVDSREMRIIEDYTINHAGITAVDFMERAALSVVDVVVNNIKKDDRICVICGRGNNGGDGAAIARLLFMRGYKVTIIPIGTGAANPGSLFELQLKKACSLGITIENRNKLDEYNVIIDAIFGIGLSRDVTGVYEQIINEINNSKGMVFSVDVPSGISADNGKVFNTAVRASHTITFGYMKKGLLFYPGAEYAGKVTVADIGFPQKAALQLEAPAFYYEPEDLKLLPVRPSYSHKGTFGKVLVIAGSKGMSGAAFLSAKAAYRMGAGLVKVLTSESNRTIIQSLLPEALFASYDEIGYLGESGGGSRLQKDLNWASAVVIGPGLGKSEQVSQLLDIVLSEARVPVIVDADAINILSERFDKADIKPEDRIKMLSGYAKPHTIITPHLMELARLTGRTVTDIKDNLIDTAAACSYNNEIVYVIKDARTVVAYKDSYYINTSGNSGMATGGSGDVLCGIIAALIAQGMDAYEASCLGVYIHGLAGDLAAHEKSSYSMMASDIIESIGKVINKYLQDN